MKKPLDVAGDDVVGGAFAVATTTRSFVVADAGSGEAAKSFAADLVQAFVERGEEAQHAETRWDKTQNGTRLVVRTPVGPAAHPVAKQIETEADVVLGSRRPGFARHYVDRLLGQA